MPELIQEIPSATTDGNGIGLGMGAVAFGGVIIGCFIAPDTDWKIKALSIAGELVFDGLLLGRALANRTNRRRSFGV